MAGKPTRQEPTREGLRFHWLILQMTRKGITGAEIARVTGIKESHLSAFKNLHDDVGAGRTGIGAEIVRKMHDGYQLKWDYFFRPYKHRGHPVTDRQGKPWVPSCEVCHRLGILNEDDYELYIFATEQERADRRQLKKLTEDVDRLVERDEEIAQLKAELMTMAARVDAIGRQGAAAQPQQPHPKLRRKRA